MRLFVAVYPPPAALDALAREVSDGLPPLVAAWRAVPVSQWHLTLAFLGEVAQDRLSELCERLSRAAGRSSPLTLALSGGGAFPAARRGQVLWVGVRGERSALDALRRLADRVGAAARRTGIAMPARAYRPHLTLARCRDPQGVDAASMVAALSGYAGPVWPVTEIVLVRSQLAPTTSHHPAARWPLGG